MSAHERTSPGRWARAAVWGPGFAVAVGAAVATAHGLFEVAVAARVPAGIAWIYPLITDGLALVAYAATARLSGSAARYAWSVVIVSAGLSGLAQASYLAADPVAISSGLTVSAALRFGVGAWPAVAAAVVAHLLYLLAAEPGPTGAVPVGAVWPGDGVRPSGRTPDGPIAMDTGRPHPVVLDGPVNAPADRAVSDLGPADGPVSTGPNPADPHTRAGQTPSADAPARDRARTAAQHHQTRHGALPSVRELQVLADVGRGTAADALKQLRDDPPQTDTGLHLVHDEPETRTTP